MPQNTIEKRLPRKIDEQGATMVEYALTAVLIAFVAIVAVGFAGTRAAFSFQNVGDCMDRDCDIISAGGVGPVGP